MSFNLYSSFHGNGGRLFIRRRNAFDLLDNLLGKDAGFDGIHLRDIRVGGRLGHGQGLHIGMHGLSHLLAGCDRVHHGARAVGHVAGGEHAGAGGVALFIDGEQTGVGGVNSWSMEGFALPQYRVGYGPKTFRFSITNI